MGFEGWDFIFVYYCLLLGQLQSLTRIKWVRRIKKERGYGKIDKEDGKKRERKTGRKDGKKEGRREGRKAGKKGDIDKLLFI